MNWNDLTYFLALYRAGTLSGAAQQLGVNNTTVARRIQRLETDLKTKLFIRHNNRYLVTDDAEDIVAMAEQAEQQVMQIEQRLSSQDQALTGSIRITSVATFINGYLLARLPDFQQKYPGIQIELIADAQQLSLTRREADLAIRMGRPETGNMVISKLTDLHYAIYSGSAKDVASDISALPWICLDESYINLPESRWQQTHYSDAKVALRVNVGLASVEAVKQRLGIAYLPCFLAKSFALTPLSESAPVRELWLLQHPELIKTQRLRVFVDWLKNQVADEHLMFSTT